MTATKTLIKNETAGAEHFGAINETFVYRVTYSPFTDTPSPRAAVADLIYQGLEGIAARPGRPLVIDSTTVDTDLIVRTVDVTCHDAGGLDVVIGCTRYNWGDTQVGDPAVRILTTPYTQTVQAWRSGPTLPSFSLGDGLGDEFDDDDWADSQYGLGAVSGSAPSSTSPEDGTYRPAGDIGGTPIDWNGNPMQLLLPMLRIEIEVLRRGGYMTVAGTGTADALKPQVLLDFIGKRNNTTFGTFAVGTLLFEAVNRSRLDGEWTACTFSFLYHPWRHAEQVPRPSFGTKAGTLSYEGDPRGIQHQRGVYWKQPYLQGADFNSTSLFTATEKTMIDDFLGVP